MAFPDTMRVLSTTVNHVTRSNQVLGPEHRVEPIVALEAMTLWAAYQRFEEKSKGSVEIGKLADGRVGTLTSRTAVSCRNEQLRGTFAQWRI